MSSVRSWSAFTEFENLQIGIQNETIRGKIIRAFKTKYLSGLFHEFVISDEKEQYIQVTIHPWIDFVPEDLQEGDSVVITNFDVLPQLECKGNLTRAPFQIYFNQETSFYRVPNITLSDCISFTPFKYIFWGWTPSNYNVVHLVGGLVRLGELKHDPAFHHYSIDGWILPFVLRDKRHADITCIAKGKLAKMIPEVTEWSKYNQGITVIALYFWRFKREWPNVTIVQSDDGASDLLVQPNIYEANTLRKLPWSFWT